jgi:hypothetical protein
MLDHTKKKLKSIFPVVSWQNSVINNLFRKDHPFDTIARKNRWLPFVPSYPVNVRSNGVTSYE